MDESQMALAAVTEPEPVRDKSAYMLGRKTFGERLIPLLVMGMECCLVYALLLVMAGFFAGQGGPLLPIWAIFLVVLFFYLFSHGLKRFVDQWSEIRLPRYLRKLLVALPMSSAVLVILVFCVWFHFYTASFALFDPAWLQAFNHDAERVDWDMQWLVLGGLFALLSWLSYQKVSERSNAALFLRKGLPLFLILVGVSLGEGLLRSSADSWQALLLLPVFVWLGLLAQSLQKASAKRRHHTANLTGSTRYQEHIIFQTILALGLVIVVALIIALFVNGQLSVYLPRGNANSGLLPDIEFTPPFKGPPPPQHAGLPTNFPHIALPVTSSEMALITLGLFIAGSVILLLLIGSIYLLATYVLRMRLRRRKRVQVRDDRTSLWNWRLFWRQCRAFFLQQCQALLLIFPALWRQFWRKPAATTRTRGDGDFYPAPLEVSTVREIYQAFLALARSQGYPRTKNETPYEFRQRLHIKEPLFEPELEAITEAYEQARYGGRLLRADEFMQLREIWSRLNGKWRRYR